MRMPPVVSALAGVCVGVGLGLAGAVPAAGEGAVSYGPMEAPGRIADRRVDQSSGLAASWHWPGALWTHNDSGHEPTLYQLDRQGVVTASVTLRVDGTLDIEDVCSFELDGEPTLAVADTGDNRRKRAAVSVMLLGEPEPRPGQHLRGHPVARRVFFTYADGPQDCESVAFDPETRSLLLVTKSWPDAATFSVPPAGLYVLPLGDAAAGAAGTAAEPRVLQRVADLTLKVTTAADLSPDGRRLVVLTYGDAYQYVRARGQTWAEALAAAPARVALWPRGQSEGLCFGRDGRTLWISSEGLNQPLFRVSPR